MKRVRDHRSIKTRLICILLGAFVFNRNEAARPCLAEAHVMQTAAINRPACLGRFQGAQHKSPSPSQQLATCKSSHWSSLWRCELWEQAWMRMKVHSTRVAPTTSYRAMKCHQLTEHSPCCKRCDLCRTRAYKSTLFSPHPIRASLECSHLRVSHSRQPLDRCILC